MKKLYSLVSVVLLACSTSFGQVEIKLWDSGTQSGTGNALNGQEHGVDGVHVEQLQWSIWKPHIQMDLQV